jgi:hypothetical protein
MSVAVVSTLSIVALRYPKWLRGPILVDRWPRADGLPTTRNPVTGGSHDAGCPDQSLGLTTGAALGAGNDIHDTPREPRGERFASSGGSSGGV